MPQSLSRVVIHLVFSVKHREPRLRTPEIRKDLHAYMAGILHGLECEPILLNGIEDHVHILCNLSRNLAIAKMVEALKTASSKWIKTQGREYHDFYWQAGYGIFSVSQSNVEAVKEYIASQEEHHRKISFQEELRNLCRKHGISFDEKFVWD